MAEKIKFMRTQALSPSSSVYDVRSVRDEGNRKLWENTSVNDLAYVLGFSYLDGDKKSISAVDKYINGIADQKKRGLLKFSIALIWATSFSDAFLVWSSSNSPMTGSISRDIPPHLQDRTVKWLLNGINENIGDDIILSGVLNAVRRIPSGDSILDEKHGNKIMEKLGPKAERIKIQDEEFLFDQLI